MTGRQSGEIGAPIGILLMALAVAWPAGPAAQAAEPQAGSRSIQERILAVLAAGGTGRDEITPPEEIEESPATQPAQTAPADETAEPADDEEWLAPPDIHVGPGGRVEMHVRNLDLASVLQMLSMQARRNIVTSKKVTGTVTANLYNVTFAEALTAILAGNGADWRERGNFIYVYTRDELAAIEAAEAPPVTRIFRLHYVRAEEVKEMIDSAIRGTPQAGTGAAAPDLPGGATPSVASLAGQNISVAASKKPEIGLAPSKETAGGDSLAQEDYVIVTAPPAALEIIEDLIAEIDVRPKQVLIEATILRALLNEDNALGIDFSMVHGVDFRSLAAVSNAGTDLNLGVVAGAQIDSTTLAANTDFRSQVPNGGFTFGFIKNDIGLFVRALEQVTDTTVLANPKVLALNKQRGEVIIGRRDGYLTTTVTQTAAVQNVEFLETGTRLLFRPFIADDGYIRLEVHPEDSTGGVTAANLPFEQTTEVTTNILVRDGHTVLIGGLFRELTTAAKGQIPAVGNIPIAGALFRNSHDTTQREEIIILLTVHIIKDDRALQEASRDLIEDVERYRVGMRQGLQCFGRERLAQAHYRWALEHLNKGRLNRALWDLDLAINNNPKFLAAIKLKEELLCKREWDEDNSAIRMFVKGLIAREQGLEQPYFGRPEPALIVPELNGPSGFEETAGEPVPVIEEPPPALPSDAPRTGGEK